MSLDIDCSSSLSNINIMWSSQWFGKHLELSLQSYYLSSERTSVTSDSQHGPNLTIIKGNWINPTRIWYFVFRLEVIDIMEGTSPGMNAMSGKICWFILWSLQQYFFKESQSCRCLSRWIVEWSRRTISGASCQGGSSSRRTSKMAATDGANLSSQPGDIKRCWSNNARIFSWKLLFLAPFMCSLSWKNFWLMVPWKWIVTGRTFTK